MSKGNSMKDYMIEKDKILICHTLISDIHILIVYADKNGRLFERVLSYFNGDDAIWCKVNELAKKAITKKKK